jgi:hypothetical protein
MASVFLVVYTSANLIGAVSYPLPSKICGEVVDQRIDWQEQRIDDDPNSPRYTFKCEEHKSRPNVQTKIDLREHFESDCWNLYGGYTKCVQLPNGDAHFVGGSAGDRTRWTIKLRDRLNSAKLPEIRPCGTSRKC